MPKVKAPSLMKDLYGIAPNATRGIPAEDFIAGIRSRKLSKKQLATIISLQSKIDKIADGLNEVSDELYRFRVNQKPDDYKKTRGIFKDK